MLKLYRRFFSGYYNILLIVLFLLFVFRPYSSQSIAYIGVWKTLFTSALILSIFNCYHPRAIKWIISVLVLPIITLSWIDLVEPQGVFVPLAILTCIFMVICVGSIVYDVLLRTRVTVEILRGVICAYFLVAFIFAYIFLLIEYYQPGTMVIRDQVVPVFPHALYFSEMLYFSFVTLLTVGFGDIVPIREWGQTAVVVEGIIGQFYIAILVSRIVSVYAFLSSRNLIHQIEKDLQVK